jgi:hypothetical protein
MLNIRELKLLDHPEINDFLSGRTVNFLQMEYTFKQRRRKESVSILEICVVLGSPELIYTLLRCFKFTPAQIHQAFEQAVREGQFENAISLLEIPEVFAYFEKSSDPLTTVAITQFVDKKLTELQIAKVHNHGDILAEDLDTWLAILRHLIRKSDNNHRDLYIADIDYIISSPSIKTIKYETGLTLYLLALEVRNDSIIEMLKLQFPNLEGVSQDLDRQGENLRVIADNRESSMRGLSDVEKKLLEELQAHYYRQLRVGKGVLFSEFKQYLKNRYLAYPAILERNNGTRLALAFDWNEFQAQAATFSHAERQNAMNAYFRHDAHTAYRWLSKPNHWINPNGQYVLHDNAHPEWGYYANFEEFIPLIVCLWLAASDENTPSTLENQTVADRVSFFIKSLALIGRAHNWDVTRPKTDTNGKIIEEECDDGQLDNPTCISGINSRISTSVVGHPLLTNLKFQMIREELHHFIHEYYVEYFGDLPNKEKRRLKDDINQMITETEPASPALKKGDIPPAVIDEWINGLRKKYGKQFDEKPEFLKLIIKRLALAEDESHISNFYKAQDLEALILPDNPKALFKKLFNRMASKVEYLENEAISNPTQYAAAATAGRKLLTRLGSAGNEYFGNKITATKLRDLSKAYVSEAKDELEKHRGWSEFFHDLAFFLTNLVSLGLASAINYAVTGELRFFKTPPTDSLVKLQRMERDLADFEEEDVLQRSGSNMPLTT